ncbi:MAG: chemotaxis protein [Rhizobiales bacterium]|nr:chemotaxis protein [Hyphomicrobiales bacterium]
MPDFKDWTHDREGNIEVRPLVGYATMIAAETAIAFRLQFLQPGDQFETPSGSVQLIVTPPQARELARALQNAAEKIEKQPVPSGPKN